MLYIYIIIYIINHWTQAVGINYRRGMGGVISVKGGNMALVNFMATIIRKRAPSRVSASEIRQQSEEDVDYVYTLTKLTVQLNWYEGQARVSFHSAISELIEHKRPDETLEIGDVSLLYITLTLPRTVVLTPVTQLEMYPIHPHRRMFSQLRIGHTAHSLDTCKLTGLSNTPWKNVKFSLHLLLILNMIYPINC